MLNLFDNYSKDSRKLQETLWNAGFHHPTLVLDEQGDLPEGVFNIFHYFMGELTDGLERIKKQGLGRPRYFNEIPIQKYWEIAGDNQSATIKDDYRLRAKIFYHYPHHLRQVKNVDWYDEQGNVRYIDSYNQFGRLYSQIIFNDKKEPLATSYYDLNGKEVVVENHVTKSLIISYKEKEYLFENRLRVILFLLSELNLWQEDMLFNSLHWSFMIANQRQGKAKNFLFWQEGKRESLPGNMEVLLSSQTHPGFVIIPNEPVYHQMVQLSPEEWQSKFYQAGYVYQYKQKAKSGKNILIFTNTDQIQDIREIIQALPQAHFHIAALTEMSSKLMQLDRFANVRLYPNVTPEQIDELWEECQIYLDINHANEILNAVEEAYLNQLLIFAFEELGHNMTYVAKEHRYKIMNVNGMVRQLESVLLDESKYFEALDKQHLQADSISRQQFNNALRNDV
ncbi:accessory Sec system glycosylation chaperone GtfB [Facklamia sp. 7083-14-GEN3]|uniref:accessory Sec system glycosylation chaperone GtfB n=1 Tax=Facklamia sp. 7083-14-GEN3 TaxID=2973478 RepID=UPI00215CD1BE|nr:accessory Sec system glycosylation chaperone GtfB [Facklamia sp. 7083-14-GEN3]MCR8968379.1 accessory Sec system glycosylation chaperone GtfB [Facklamia sp. 7083-14-GEN3]